MAENLGFAKLRSTLGVKKKHFFLALTMHRCSGMFARVSQTQLEEALQARVRRCTLRSSIRMEPSIQGTELQHRDGPRGPLVQSVNNTHEM